MDDLFIYDQQNTGSKGLIFIGENILVYRRDDKTNLYPFHIDLPGGGAEPYETPFQTFQRELLEEFTLKVRPENITYYRKYNSVWEINKVTYFLTARLPENNFKKIVFGNEGTEFMRMSLNEYLERTDAWPLFQERAVDYKSSLGRRLKVVC